MPRLIMSPRIQEKLQGKHSVTEEEVVECFMNKEDSPDLLDLRAHHHTDPPSRWFIAKTNSNRILKIVYIFDVQRGVTIIKTAFEPSQAAIDYYERNSKKVMKKRPK